MDYEKVLGESLEVLKEAINAPSASAERLKIMMASLEKITWDEVSHLEIDWTFKNMSDDDNERNWQAFPNLKLDMKKELP
jgi:hypothetical protein